MEEYIKNLIKLNGPITVSQFMSEALFNPNFGYYTTKNPIGKKGDFITSPEISQVFGELISAYFINLWQNNYSSQSISLVEMGAGHGTLMADLLNIAKKIPNFLEKVKINIIEISPSLKKIQQEKLKDFPIKWWDNFEDFNQNNKDPIFFIANELLDCFPINQYVKIDNLWHEKLVSLDNKNLCFIKKTTSKAINEKIEDLTKKEAQNNAIFEHSPLLENFVMDLFNSIKTTNGIGILIDYGYIKNQFIDSLQSLKNHKFNNIFDNIGQSDITFLVNFSRLKEISDNLNLQSWIITQKEFLESLGIEIRRQNLLKEKNDIEKNLINSSINRLIDPKEMGELFKVFIFNV